MDFRRDYFALSAVIPAALMTLRQRSVSRSNGVELIFLDGQLGINSTPVPKILLTLVTTSPWAQVAPGSAFAVAPPLLVTNHQVIDDCALAYVLLLKGFVGIVVDADAVIRLCHTNR